MLATCTGDVLRLISELISGEEVFRLLLCGSTALSLRLRSSAERLNIVRNAFSPFPHSAYNLPRLRELSVSVDVEGSHSYPLELGTSGTWPKEAIESLTHLSFSFTQSGLLCDGPRLSSTFPNLTHLHISRCRGLENPDLLRGMPRTLEFLEIRSQDTRQLSINLDEDTRLPPNLTCLCLEVPVFMTWPFIWPCNLQTLICTTISVPYNFFRLLPPRVEEIELSSMIFTSPVGDPTPVGTDELPKTLRIMRAAPAHSGVWFEPTFKNLIFRPPMPPNLMYWDVNLDGSPELDAALQDLPTYNEHHIRNEENLTSDVISNLPPDVRHFHFGNFCRSTESLALPRNLLSIWGCPLQQSMDLADLPRRLVRLVFKRPPIGPEWQGLPPQAWRSLPSTLQSLDMDIEAMESSHCLLELTQIQSLALRFSSSFRSSFIEDSELGHRIPPQLKSLHLFFMSGIFKHWVEWAGQLGSSCPGLLSLEIYPWDLPSHLECPPYYLTSLPKSLRSLTARIGSGLTYAPELLRQLPPDIRSLELRTPNGASEAINITEEHLKALPHTLQQLVLMKISPVPRMWEIIPPGIAHVIIRSTEDQSFGDDDKNDARHRYYKNPIWMGTRDDMVPTK